MRRAGLLVTICIVALAAAALAVRLPALDARPMHCDEAVQAVKAGHLLETGEYRYDPYEFHGPTLNYFTLPALWLSGDETFAESSEAAYRLVPVIFGAAVILLLLLVTDGLGRGAAIVAGVLTAVSPAMVFFSRYYIHEMLLVFFTFAAIGCGWRYLRCGAIGRAIAAGAAVGLMHATKETWVLAAAAMVAGLLGCFLWMRLEQWLTGRGGSATAAPTSDPLVRQLPEPLGRQLYRRPWPIVAAIAAACVLAVVLYSSFFTHWQGPLDSILTYETYLHRGGGGNHNQPWDFYFQLFAVRVPARGFFWPDALIAGLAIVGFVVSLLPASVYVCHGRPGRDESLAKSATSATTNTAETAVAHTSMAVAHLLPRFLAFYMLALMLAYTVLPYKTPWCMLGFLHGMILLSGVGAAAVVRWLPGWPLKVIACLLVGAGVTHLAWQCCAVNFRFPADSDNPYVYVHTTSDTVKLAEQVDRLAGLADEGRDITIHVVTPDNYWPLPWYLRKFPRARYWPHEAEDEGQAVDPQAAVESWWDETNGRPQAAVLILTPELPEHVEDYLAAHYRPQGIRSLRPEVFVNIYISHALWEELAAAANSGAQR